MSILTSCTSKEPLAKLEENGVASVLNYNLPQSTTYNIETFIKLEIPKDSFNDSELVKPKDTWWDKLKAVPLDINEIGELLDRIGASYGIKSYISGASASTKSNTKAKATVESGNVRATVESNNKVKVKSLGTIVELATEELTSSIRNGLRPVQLESLSGSQYLKMVSEPEETNPSIFIQLRMKMSSYLGDYAAGQTISTFSLLPGEKTTISIRNYLYNEETKEKSQSIVDSYSDRTKDSFQETVTEETETSFNSSFSSSEEDTDSMEASIEKEASGGISLKGITASVRGLFSGSASSVNTTNEAMSTATGIITNSLNSHVQTVDTERQIEVNTETKTSTTSSTTTETEETITREIENINKSRVMNFVFRQLLQQYITLIYLYDVKFFYTNGYEESIKRGNLSTLEGFLSSLLKPDFVEGTKNEIYRYLCNISDYSGTNVSFIEAITEKNNNCINPDQGTEIKYVRKRKDLAQTYEGKTVNGIITKVNENILRTPSVIVEGLLGQGECLDCYNQQMQAAAYTASHLTNKVTQQMINIIDDITDPIEKAKLYKKVFTTCCDVPQSGCCPEDVS